MTSKQTAASMLRQYIDKATFPTNMDKHSALQWIDELASSAPPQCLLQIAEPATAGTAVRAFRDYLGVHDGIKLGGQAMDDMALDLARIALDFKHLVEPRHPDDAAVDALAVLMKAKLAKQRGKGYGGWDTDCTQQHLSNLLRGHVDKGDPVDVANFCAMLSARGEGITAQATPLPLLLRDIARDLGVTVPEACVALKPWGDYSTNSAVTAEMATKLREAFPNPAPQAVQAAVPVGGQSRFKGEKDWQWCSAEHVAMVLATPSEWQGYEVHYVYAHPAEGVPAQRAAFVEAWQIINYPIPCNSRMRDDGSYADPKVQAAWEKWQARAAIAATQPAAQGLDAPWIHVSERLPELRQQVLAGYFYQDTWLKGMPWVFSVGVCSMYENPEDPCFPQGKRWQTHGCSHNDIAYWMPMPKSPELPKALAAQAKQGGADHG